METAGNMGEWPRKNYRMVPEQSGVDRARPKRRITRILRQTIWSRGRQTLKLIVTGAGGMVGRAVVRYCTTRGAQVTAMEHAVLDITSESMIASAFERERPDVLINCAA